METQKKHYSLEFKLKALELVQERGSLISVARELNINKETLRNWRRGQHIGKEEGAVYKLKSKEEEENIRLRKELYEVKLECDILKKAVGIFSKSDR